MKAQKSKEPAAKPDNESSSGSDDSESDDLDSGPNIHVAEEPECSQSQDEDNGSDSESDEIRPSKTFTNEPPRGSTSIEGSKVKGDDNAKLSKTVAEVPEKASTLKRSRSDDAGGPTKKARRSKPINKEPENHVFHKSYNESSGDCTLLAGNTYFKVFRLTCLEIWIQ
jgi:hypothetical protein